MPRLYTRGPFIGVNYLREQGYLTPRHAADALNVHLDAGRIQRRAGYTELKDFSGDGAILGLFDYEKNDGTLLRLIHAGSKLKVWNPASDTVTEIATGLPTTALTAFAAVNNRVYFSAPGIFKVTDGSAVYDAEIAPPSAPPAVATSGSAGSGSKRGTYDYRYTFYSSTWGQESPSSPASSTVTCDNQNVLVSSIQTTSDARVDKVRLYRRKTSASESLWTFYKEISEGTTSDTDSGLDQDVIATRIAPYGATAGVTGFKFMAYQAGVLFMAGSDPTSLYYTRPDQPWAIQQPPLVIGSGGDTDPITGIWAFGGQIIVFKRRSIWSVSGNSPDTFYVRKVIHGTGCVGHWSIVEVDGVLYFAGERSFYGFDGGSVVDIAGELGNTFSMRNPAGDAGIIAIHDFNRGYICWHYPVGGLTNNEALCYFYRNSRVVGERSWCPWRFAQDVATATLFTDSSTKAREVFYGLHNGSVVKVSGSNDDGQPILFYWQTPFDDREYPERYKRWQEICVEFTPQASSSACLIKYSLNPLQAPGLWQSHDSTDPIFRRDLDHSSRLLQLRFESNTDTPLEILSWSINYELSGRA